MEINIEEHLGLARKVAGEFSRLSYCSYGYEELESQAFVGLCSAAKKFDINKGYTFSTFAVPIIRYWILRTFRDDRWLSQKRGVRHEIYSLNIKVGEKQEEEMQDMLKDDFTFEEVSIDSIWIKDLLLILNDKERVVIKLHYFDNLPQQEVAKVIGVTQATVSRRLRKAIKKLREAI
ncbi:MAG: sigma-70 family RNA polymerase sigma factor [Clostridium sp.]